MREKREKEGSEKAGESLALTLLSPLPPLES